MYLTAVRDVGSEIHSLNTECSWYKSTDGPNRVISSSSDT